jgi:hypothetical protein
MQLNVHRSTVLASNPAFFIFLSLLRYLRLVGSGRNYQPQRPADRRRPKRFILGFCLRLNATGSEVAAMKLALIPRVVIDLDQIAHEMWRVNYPNLFRFCITQTWGE